MFYYTKTEISKAITTFLFCICNYTIYICLPKSKIDLLLQLHLKIYIINYLLEYLQCFARYNS